MKTWIMLAALAFAPAAAGAQTPGPVTNFSGGSNSTDFMFQWTVPSGATQYDVRWSYSPFDQTTVDGGSLSWDANEPDCPVPTPGPTGSTQEFCATFCRIYCHAGIPIYWAVRAKDSSDEWGPVSSTIVLALTDKESDDDDGGSGVGRTVCGGASAGTSAMGTTLIALALLAFRARR